MTALEAVAPPSPRDPVARREASDATRLRLTFSQLRYITVSTAGLVVLLALVISPRVPADRLWTWLAVYQAITVVRLALAWWYRRRPRTDAELRAVLPLLTVVFALSAGSWGGVAFVSTDPTDTVVYVVELLFAGGLIAAGTQSMIGTPKILIMSATLMIVPLLVTLIRSGVTEHYYLAVVAVAYLVSALQFGRKNYMVLQDSIALRFGNLDLVERLTQEKATAERATAAKNQFLAAASHDIRQPLHAAFLFLGALETNPGVRDSVALQRLRASLTSARQMLDALLDVSRLDAGVVERVDVPIHAASLGERVIELFRPVAERKGITVALRAPRELWLDSDPTLLQRLLANLTANAVKYTNSGAVLLAFRRRKRGCLVQVWDTGIGIPEEDFSSIFDEFKQLGNSQRDGSRGIGLGLAIVRRLCRILETDISVRSKLGHGSVFSFHVPLGQPVVEGTAPATSVDVAGRSRVLVVDDDALVREGLLTLLTTWGHEVITASDVEDARRVTRELEGRGDAMPELLLVDFRLPEEKTALDAIEAIREAAHTNIPAVVITGDTHPERIREATSLGCPVIFKPVPPDVLQRVLSDALRTNA
ncbi:MAG: response regulator [Myxococcales bacterium]|jgi:signal transduction histidine kinase/ActR/RegA family two-component response regulator|nr:response regulator [Myxococcales bacterium]